VNSQLLLVLFCLLAGLILRWTERLPKNTHQSLNAYVIWVSLPALVLVQIPKLLQSTAITKELLIPLSMALPIGILVDQPGSFLVLSTLGIFVASVMSPQNQRKFQLSRTLKNVFQFPPFIALLASSIWWVSGTYREGVATQLLDRLASTLVPLALVAVGFQLRLSIPTLKAKWVPLALGLGFKLFLAPLFFYTLYVVVLGSTSFSTKVTILESAMASMITASVVAEEFGFDSEITSLMLGIGIPLSLLTVSFWNSWL